MTDTNMLAIKVRELGELNEYKRQAEHLLHIARVQLSIVKAVPQLSPRWAKGKEHGTCYTVALGKMPELWTLNKYEQASEVIERLATKKIQFFFWNSIAAKEAGRNSMTGEKKPSAYDVLAGLYMPVSNFKDFCGNFGYSDDSREAEKTYNEVIELNEKLESIFTPEELEALQEIA